MATTLLVSPQSISRVSLINQTDKSHELLLKTVLLQGIKTSKKKNCYCFASKSIWDSKVLTHFKLFAGSLEKPRHLSDCFILFILVYKNTPDDQKLSLFSNVCTGAANGISAVQFSSKLVFQARHKRICLSSPSMSRSWFAPLRLGAKARAVGRGDPRGARQEQHTQHP